MPNSTFIYLIITLIMLTVSQKITNQIIVLHQRHQLHQRLNQQLKQLPKLPLKLPLKPLLRLPHKLQQSQLPQRLPRQQQKQRQLRHQNVHQSKKFVPKTVMVTLNYVIVTLTLNAGMVVKIIPVKWRVQLAPFGIQSSRTATGRQTLKTVLHATAMKLRQLQKRHQQRPNLILGHLRQDHQCHAQIINHTWANRDNISSEINLEEKLIPIHAQDQVIH